MTTLTVRSLLALALALLAAVTPVQAQGLDAASAEALAATLKMLQDPAARAGAIGKDPKGMAADQQVRSMAGSDKATQEMYELAAMIFNDLTRGSGGDLQKMTQALQRGQSDPAAFAAGLSPQTLQKLRELSGKLPASR